MRQPRMHRSAAQSLDTTRRSTSPARAAARNPIATPFDKKGRNTVALDFRRMSNKTNYRHPKQLRHFFEVPLPKRIRICRSCAPIQLQAGRHTMQTYFNCKSLKTRGWDTSRVTQEFDALGIADLRIGVSSNANAPKKTFVLPEVCATPAAMSHAVSIRQ